MAISDRIKAEARRTIDGMQRFYEKYSDDVDDAEELEHRIARVEASMEGCNGLSQDDKIQKTAENLFELTCAQERSYDSLRREMKLARDDYKSRFSEMKEQISCDFKNLQKDLKDGLKSVMKKIEDSGADSVASGASNMSHAHFLWRFVSEHPMISFYSFIIVILLVFISGHFDIVQCAVQSALK